MSHFNFHFANWESQQVLDSDIAKKSFEIAKDGKKSWKFVDILATLSSADLPSIWQTVLIYRFWYPKLVRTGLMRLFGQFSNTVIWWDIMSREWIYTCHQEADWGWCCPWYSRRIWGIRKIPWPHIGRRPIPYWYWELRSSPTYLWDSSFDSRWVRRRRCPRWRKWLCRRKAAICQKGSTSGQSRSEVVVHRKCNKRRFPSP